MKHHYHKPSDVWLGNNWFLLVHHPSSAYSRAFRPALIPRGRLIPAYVGWVIIWFLVWWELRWLEMTAVALPTHHTFTSKISMKVWLIGSMNAWALYIWNYFRLDLSCSKLPWLDILKMHRYRTKWSTAKSRCSGWYRCAVLVMKMSCG